MWHAPVTLAHWQCVAVLESQPKGGSNKLVVTVSGFFHESHDGHWHALAAALAGQKRGLLAVGSLQVRVNLNRIPLAGPGYYAM